MAVQQPPMLTSPRSPNTNQYSTPHHPEALCWHVTVGSAQGSIGWLCNPDSGASANYLIDRAGVIYELVPPTVSAWANGAVNKPDMGNPLIAGWVNAHINPNTRSISVEHERLQSANNQPGGFTEAQHHSTVALGAWLCERFGIPANRTTIFGHRSIDSVDRYYCPGLAESEWDQWVGEIAALVAGEGGGEVRVPERGTAMSYLTADGQPVTVVAWDGEATSIDGTAFIDVGVTVTNAQGEHYSRSLQNNTMQPWLKTSP